MNPCASIIGVRSVDFTLAQELEIDATQQKSEPLLNRLGKFVSIETFGRKNNFSIKGKGACPDAVVAGGSISITGLNTGVTYIMSRRREQKGGQYHDWSCQGANWPFATAPA